MKLYLSKLQQDTRYVVGLSEHLKPKSMLYDVKHSCVNRNADFTYVIQFTEAERRNAIIVSKLFSQLNVSNDDRKVTNIALHIIVDNSLIAKSIEVMAIYVDDQITYIYVKQHSKRYTVIEFIKTILFSDVSMIRSINNNKSLTTYMRSSNNQCNVPFICVIDTGCKRYFASKTKYITIYNNDTDQLQQRMSADNLYSKRSDSYEHIPSMFKSQHDMNDSESMQNPWEPVQLQPIHLNDMTLANSLHTVSGDIVPVLTMPQPSKNTLIFPSYSYGKSSNILNPPTDVNNASTMTIFKTKILK